MAYDYLLALKQHLTFEDIDKIKEYVLTKSWWDTIDFLSKVIGDIGLHDTRVKGLMLNWSLDANIWIKRTSIEHQLAYKDKTDINLLAQIIINSLGTDEFFINYDEEIAYYNSDYGEWYDHSTALEQVFWRKSMDAYSAAWQAAADEADITKER